MRIIILASASILMVSSAYVSDPASDQLSSFKTQHGKPIGMWTSSNGAPVDIRETLALNAPSLINNELLEVLAHTVRERIPERVVHAKGAGAYGYFKVTHNVTDICKAHFISKIGMTTPVVVRFSLSSMDKGEPDTVSDSRGFACKFYTEEGNFDIVGFHTPMFMFKEPFLFQPISKIVKRHPVTNLRDQNMLWDLVTLRPETVNFFLYTFGDNGVPNGYRHMPGFGIHTYQVYNKFGETFFLRWWFDPKAAENLFFEEAIELAMKDPDYAVRDLYNAIENHNYPTWTLKVQVLTLEDVKTAKIDVFDITKMLPENKYPSRPVGKLVLNRNPKNFFADVEQAGFCPGNLVPGILGAPDKAFEARRFAYKDAQRYRLGGNFNKIPVNRPRSILSYDRDGVPPIGDNEGDAPNYYPNSFYGPVPTFEKNRPALITIKQRDDSHDFSQAADIYINLSNAARSRLAKNVVMWSLNKASEEVQRRVLRLFKLVHPDLAYRTSVALAAVKSDTS